MTGRSRSGAQTIRLRPPRIAAPSRRLFAEGRAEAAFPQLAAGPAIQLARAGGGAGKDRSFHRPVDLTVEMEVINPFDFFLEPAAEQFPFSYAAELKAELEPYLGPRRLRRGVQRLCRAIPREKKQTTTFLFDLNASCRSDISYLIRMEPGIQTPEETLSQGSGSCRDTAWLLVQLLRHLGLAARFASGYLDPAQAGCEIAGWASGTEAISPICMPGAKSICRARAGSGLIRPRACLPAKAIFRWPAPPIPLRRRRSRGAVEPGEVLFDFDMT